MLRSALRLLVPILVLFAVYIGLERLGVVPLLITAPAGVVGDQSRFAFKLSRNPLGDRLLLTSRMRASYKPQQGAPDIVEVLPNQGAFEGTFVWTVVPEQKSERRLRGEFSNAGRVYTVCEFLMRQTGAAIERAERFQPINNDGPRFRNPQEIDPSQLHALYDAITAEQGKLDQKDKTSTEPVNVSPELVTLASSDVFYCLGTKPPGSH